MAYPWQEYAMIITNAKCSPSLPPHPPQQCEKRIRNYFLRVDLPLSEQPSICSDTY